MKKKKNKFWLFVCSLIPGAGEMYLGFMKMGLSIMVAFAVLVVIADILQIGVLAMFPVVFYIYSFFHANNLGGLDDEAFFNTSDEYMFHIDEIVGKVRNTDALRRLVAGLFIFLGIMLLGDVVLGIFEEAFGWDNWLVRMIYYGFRDLLPKCVIGFAIIIGGIHMIRGKKVKDAGLVETYAIEQKEVSQE